MRFGEACRLACNALDKCLRADHSSTHCSIVHDKDLHYLQEAPKKRRDQAGAAEPPRAAAAQEAAGSVKRPRINQGTASQTPPVGRGPAPKLMDSSSDIKALQAELVMYEPATIKLHLELSTLLLKKPSVREQYDQLVECCSLKRAGTHGLFGPQFCSFASRSGTMRVLRTARLQKLLTNERAVLSVAHVHDMGNASSSTPPASSICASVRWFSTDWGRIKRDQSKDSFDWSACLGQHGSVCFIVALHMMWWQTRVMALTSRWLLRGLALGIEPFRQTNVSRSYAGEASTKFCAHLHSVVDSVSSSAALYVLSIARERLPCCHLFSINDHRLS